MVVELEEKTIHYLRLAQFRLYEELGFFDSILHANCTIKSYSMSFGKTGRLDWGFYNKALEIRSN